MDDTRHAGFSLIELLVTLALAALLAGLAIPATGRFIDNSRLRSAAETLSRELQLARSHALGHGVPVYFTLSDAGGDWCYGWSERPACDCRAAPAATNSCTTGAGRRLHRQGSGDFPDTSIQPSRTLRFSPARGTATAATMVVINAREQLRVVLSALGRVRICSPSAKGYVPC